MTSAIDIARGWAKRRTSLDEAFWDSVYRPAADACWPWTRRLSTTKDGSLGYGTFHRFGKTLYAHRRALELTLGRTLARDEHVLHSCDNPPCCNPAHLRVGTHAQNMADMVARGRHVGTRGQTFPTRRRPTGEARICQTPGCGRRTPELDYARCRECIESRFFGGPAK